MSRINGNTRTWKQSLEVWMHPKVAVMLFLGISAGLPILLIFSTLSIWLTEAGVTKSTVTFFSWAALGYSFKFVWAPVVDLLPLPFLTKMLGRRRSWLLVAQFAVIAAIVWMALTNPVEHVNSLTIMAIAAVMLGFSSATQDILIDAYRIECAETSLQAILASTYIAGYRVGMLIAGAGSLFIAGYLGTTKVHYDYQAWKVTYLCMAAVMLFGVLTTLCISEPDGTDEGRHEYSVNQYVRFLLLFTAVVSSFILTFFYSAAIVSDLKVWIGEVAPASAKVAFFIIGALRFAFAVIVAALFARIISKFGVVDSKMVHSTYVEPVKDFFNRYNGKTAVLILMLVGFYRLSDIVLGVISNVFYIDMGFSKEVIASVIKTFGLVMTLLGGFLGGVLTLRFGIHKILFLGAALSSVTNLLFMVLARSGTDLTMLTVVIAADNLSAGIATTAFVAYLSSLTSISFTAAQYAMFSSMMVLLPKLIGGYSGTMVSAFGYENFFLLTAVIGIPVLYLIWLIIKNQDSEENASSTAQ